MEYYFNNGKYIVPLDAVDESLMSLNSNFLNKMDSYKPLWSTKVLNLRNEKCYYQIELDEGLSESGFDTNNEATCGDDNNKLKTYICFICNVKVPEEYTRAHINSYKHEMYLTIANAAVERINKNMNQKCYTIKTKRSLYFCETCVTVMPIADKPVHLLSNLHKRTLKRDELLNNFVNLYVNDNAEVNNDIVILNSQENSKGDVNLEKTDVCDDSLNDNLTNTLDDKYKSETAFIQKPVDNVFDYYSVNDMDTDPAHLVKCIDENHYLIQIEGDCGLKVEFDNYHAIDKLTKQRYQCKLCTDIFKRKQKHIVSEKHLKGISLVLKDKHCIRELNSTKSHCILCNELFDFDDQHINSEIHKEQLQRAIYNPEENVISYELAREEKFDVREKVNGNWDDDASTSSKLKSSSPSDANNENNYPLSIHGCCDVCNAVMHVSSLRAHALGRKHKAKEKRSVNYLMNKQPGQKCFTCQVCNIPVRLKEIQNHIANSLHDSHYINFLSRNDISAIDTGIIFCGLCKIYMMKGNEIHHVRSKRHEIVFKQLRGEDNIEVIETKSKDIEISKNLVTLEPVVQNQSLDDDPCKKFKQEIFKSTDDAVSYRSESLCMSLKPNQKNKVPENVVVIETDLDSNVNEATNNTESINNESESDKLCANNSETANSFLLEKIESMPVDAKKIRTQADANTEVVENINQETAPSLMEGATQSNKVNDKLSETKKRKNPIKKYDKFVLHTTSNEKEMFCNICKGVVPNNKRSVKEHLYGLKHNNNASQLLEDNQMKKTDDMFLCVVCNDHIFPGNQFSHIESKVHKKNKCDLSKNGRTPKNRSSVEKDDTENDLKDNNKKNEKNCMRKRKSILDSLTFRPYKDNAICDKNLNESTEPDDVDQLICNFCHVVIPNDVASRNGHTESLKHAEEKKLFLDRNEILDMGNMVRCFLCVQEMKASMLFKHVKDQFHLKMLDTWMPSFDENSCSFIPDSFLIKRHKKRRNKFKEERLLKCGFSLIDEKMSAHVHEEMMNNDIRNRKKINMVGKNGVVIREGRCYCRCCHEHFSISESMAHINKSKHLCAHKDTLQSNQRLTKNDEDDEGD